MPPCPQTSIDEAWVFKGNKHALKFVLVPVVNFQCLVVINYIPVILLTGYPRVIACYYAASRFERERTCPLCRALVKPADIRSFGDGSTSLFFQLF